MIAVYIIGGILLFFALLLLLRIGVLFCCYNKKPQFVLSIGGIKLRFDMDDFKKQAEEQAEEQAEQKETKKKEKKPKEKKAVLDILRIIKDGAARFYEKYKRYARLDRYMLKINLGTDDPAKTAVLYGAVAAAAGTLHSFAMSVRKKRGARVVETEVKPDFIAESTDIAIELGFSLRLWQIVSCAWTLWRTKKKIDKLPPKKEKKKGDKSDERQTVE